MDRGVRRLSALAALCACVAPAQAREPARDWRRVATAADRARLRGWRDAWMTATASADRSGERAALAVQGPLLDPDRALADPLPPTGQYRCRILKLGARTAAFDDVRERPPVACAVDPDRTGLSFCVLAGAQRPTGAIFADSARRGVFLGTLMLANERRPMAYGRDASRDMVGLVERVGDRRWRIALPWPRFESTLDVIELTPA